MRRIATIALVLLILTACTGVKEFVPEFDVIVLLPAEGLGDRSFADRVYEGTEIAIKGSGARVTYHVPENLAAGEDWVKNIPNLTFSTPDPALIIIAGAQYGDAMEQIEGHFDPHKVIFIGPSNIRHSSLAVLDFRTFAPAYIGGYLSAKCTPGARSVIIAGMDAAFLKDYENGFTRGVLDAGGVIDPPIYLSHTFSGFEMPDSAYRLTTEILHQYDLIFALSAGSNFGIINACRDYPEQRYAVGIDADQSWMGKTVVTGSVIKDVSHFLTTYVHDFSKGIFRDGYYLENMESGSTDFLINPLLIDEKDKTQELINNALQKEGNQP